MTPSGMREPPPTDERARLRIAFVYDALVPYHAGGAERRFHELATRLADRHDVHYVTWRFWGPDPIATRDGITLHGVGPPQGFYGSDGKRTIREAAEFALRLPGALADLRADVMDVSATPYLPLYAAWVSSRVTATPMVATWHEFWGEHWDAYLPDRPVVARVARWAEAGARRLGDRRVAVSRFTADRMTAQRRSPLPIEVVGNGVDLSMTGARAPADMGSDVLYVGRLIDEKRVDLLIRAIATLEDRGSTVRCVIAGDGPERERLTALAAALGVDRHVFFVGHVEDERITGLMQASSILVLPSLREGYGIAVVEGQACGLVPIVVRSPLSAAPGLVTSGRDGIVCDATADELAAAIGGLLSDRAMLDRMARSARETASARGWDARARDMERIYRDVAARRRAAEAGFVRRDGSVGFEAETAVSSSNPRPSRDHA